MVGVALRQGRHLQEPVLIALIRVDGGDVEDALSEGAGLVKDHDLGVGQHLQVVAALHQNARPGGPADAAEEAQRHRDHQGAGAGDDQEDQGLMEPLAPVPAAQQGGEHGQQHGRHHHAGGVVPGEPGDEVLRLGLFAGGVLHQVQDLGHGGLLKGLGDPNQGLPGEGGGVQGGAPLQDDAVQGHPLSGLDDDGVSHLHLIGVHLDQFPVLLHIGVVRADVHQGGDGLPGLAHGVALEELAHLVEEHDEDGLGVLAGGKGPHSGNGHQEVLVKDLAVGDVPHRLPEHIPADEQVGDQVEHPGSQGKGRAPVLGDMADTHQGQRPGEPEGGQRKQRHHCQQGGREQDAPECPFLFLGHRDSLSPY